MLSKAELKTLKKIKLDGADLGWNVGRHRYGKENRPILYGLDEKGLIRAIKYDAPTWKFYEITPAGLAALEAEGGK